MDYLIKNTTKKQRAEIIKKSLAISIYSIRDKFVLAALDKKDYPEPEHLQSLLRYSIASGISKKVKRLSSIQKLPKEEER